MKQLKIGTIYNHPDNGDGWLCESAKEGFAFKWFTMRKSRETIPVMEGPDCEKWTEAVQP